MLLRISIIFLLLIPTVSYCQLSDKEALIEFHKHYDKGIQAMDIYMYDIALEELEVSIEIASIYQLEEALYSAKISLAELMRKTGDHEQGLKALEEIPGTSAFPVLHVRKLGRKAALIQERPSDTSFYQKRDLMLPLLEEAILIAETERLDFELAGLLNEMAYLNFHLSNTAAAQDAWIQAYEIFDSLGNDRYTVNVLYHLLKTEVLARNFKKADSLHNAMKPMYEGKNWYSTESDLYSVLSLQASLMGDSLLSLNYQLKASQAHHNLALQSSQNKLQVFRTIYENDKLELEVQKQGDELEKQSKQKKELAIYLSVFGALALLLVFVLIRERKLKRNLKQANQELAQSLTRNEMLIKESNHRIKNNLQMIISMLKYSQRDSSQKNSLLYDRISGKINAISSLHKHLDFNVHNEQVSLKIYFNEIIGYYNEVVGNTHRIEATIPPVLIPSQKIVYFGLVLNELLSNSIEHSTSLEKRITIEIRRDKEFFTFTYYDDSNIPADSEEKSGSKLIKDLILRIGRNLTMDKTMGKYQFEFDV